MNAAGAVLLVFAVLATLASIRSARADDVVVVASRDPGGRARLATVAGGVEQPASPRLDGVRWVALPLRESPVIVESMARVSLDATGSLPRLHTPHGQLLAFSEEDGRPGSSGLAFVSTRGVDVLLHSSDDRYAIRRRGAVLGSDGLDLALVLEASADGADRESLVTFDLRAMPPSVSTVELPAGVESIDADFVFLTSLSAYVAVDEPGGTSVYRAPLTRRGGSTTAERVAGPFDKLTSLAGSAGAVTFIAGVGSDELNVYVTRDGEATLNVTRSPDEYLEHRADKPRLAVSDSGDAVLYHLDIEREPETFVHPTDEPGPSGRVQVTKDDRFNPYIDMESFVVFRGELALFGGGHHDQSVDVFLHDVASGETLNLTRTGSPLLPPYLVTGNLAVHSAATTTDGDIVIHATGFEGDRSVVVASLADGAWSDELGGIIAVEPVATPGGDTAYFCAQRESGAWILVGVAGGTLEVLANSGSPPTILGATDTATYLFVASLGIVALDAETGFHLLARLAEATSVGGFGANADGSIVYAIEIAGGERIEYRKIDPDGTESVLFEGAADRFLLAALDASATFTRGDANGDGSIDVSDAVATLLYLFASGNVRCLDAADADDDGGVRINDALYVLNALFSPGAPSIPPPSPARGLDPTADALGCGA